MRAAFFDSEKFSEEIPLRPINFDGIDNPDTCFVPDSEGIDDTSCDLFHDESQNVSNIDHNSVIIPETQFDPDGSNNSSDTSCFLNQYFKPISSTIAAISESSVDNEIENNGEENGDFFKVTADPNDCEPQITSLESQPIMANLDKSLLENFFSSDDSSSGHSSERIEGAKENGQTNQTNTGSKADNRRSSGKWSVSTTPDNIDFEEIDKQVNKRTTSVNVNTSNQTVQSTDNALIDTEDLFAMFTQPVSKNIPLKEKPNEVTLVEKDKVLENVNDDVFDALTQKMPTATATEPTFTKPMEPAKKKKSIVAQNDSGKRFGIESIDDNSISICFFFFLMF